ncbi:hypothetical protein IX332_000283 [Porphyromonas levii]|nr:hypothetical protein [Porphyromonas levii]MBR8712741.1 hypothetical protein [Porphyromonas levii]MBR8714762.1 hypothetical protein [Porphyromonas levii]MBR8727274.1 hypothetical protein [Porphyromonas levii]MBR8728975.1 hypothetical protein [Porphyromonas levii]
MALLVFSMKVHYFNPGYEVTVEQGNSYYTPPRMVRRLRKDLQTLPLYYAQPHEGVYLSSPIPEELMCERFIVDHDCISEVLPWGWAPELKGLFPYFELPYSLEEMRLYSSRTLGIELWHAVYRQALSLFRFAPPREVTQEESVEQGKWVLKEDFSSSGRGIEFVTPEQDPNAIIARRLGKQPGKRLFIEPFYEIAEERGYEFWRTKVGEIIYLGCHRAMTEGGRYKGSYLGLPTTGDEAYIDALVAGLRELPLGDYTGVIGVDSALYCDGAKERFVPCLEVNVRPTMGYVALCIQRDWLSKGRRGRFMILSKGDALLQSLTSLKPLYLSDKNAGHTPGLYPLTPILEDTYFVACLQVL